MLHRRIAHNSAMRRASELRGSNSLHLRFDNTPAKLAPYNAARTFVRGEFIVFGRCSALSGRLLGARPWISKRGFWDFPPLPAMKQNWTLPAMKQNWTLFAFPRRILQRPSIWPLWAPQWLTKPGLRSFPPLLAMKRRWTLFAFPRRIIQRPSEMTGRAVPVAIPVRAGAKA
jgi:hypothetical protein